MTILILGLGRSGNACERYFEQRSISFRSVDKKKGNDLSLANLDGVSRVVKSPGISIDHPLLVEATNRNIPICTEIDLALPHLAHKTLIGVTGSNGKTTTTLALKEVLGDTAITAGNIGIPLLDVIDTKASVIIVELSSFQLEVMEQRSLFECGVVLNLSPNHLDFHQTMERYVAAKMRLEAFVKPSGCFLMENNYLIYKEKVESFFKERYEEGGDKIFAHDLANFAAVYAICRHLNVTDSEFARKIIQVHKPPHRLEKVGVYDQVLVINDSKATSVDATLKAVQALEKPTIIIVGGVDKGGDYQCWLPAFRGKIRHVFAYGRAKDRIEKEIGRELALTVVDTLEKAVVGALQFVRSNETLLLSPGCSSYDQYNSYEERGEHFKQLVHEMMVEGRKHEST